MKNLIFFFFLFSIMACKNEKNKFDIDVSDQPIKAEIINITDDIYNPTIPFETLKVKYPFMFSEDVADEVYDLQRKDSLELYVYQQIKEKINLDSLEMELTTLFQHIKHYYPNFESPTIYTYSSVIDEEKKMAPISYEQSYNTLLIALDYFLGSDNDLYKAFKVEKYLRVAMNPENITPRASMAIGETIPLMNIQNNQFLNYMVTYGKVLLLQDAFLPTYSDALKIGYTPEEINWCYANERNMWDYFIQNDYLFSDDKKLLQRFMALAPFSKFYISNEDHENVDIQSPGGVGKWLGWQIVRQYHAENPDVSLEEIMANRNFEQIFKESKFQPK